jgi:hypothetical protein
MNRPHLDRPLPPDPADGRACDWGRDSSPSIGWRWTVAGYWLPVCERHTGGPKAEQAGAYVPDTAEVWQEGAVADLQFGYGRVWAAPVGTPLNGPGWVEIGQAHDDGLVIPAEDVPPVSLNIVNGPGIVLVLERDRRTGQTRMFCDDGTPRSRRRLAKESARFDRDVLTIRWPQASRVKREYRRRRR